MYSIPIGSVEDIKDPVWGPLLGSEDAGVLLHDLQAGRHRALGILVPVGVQQLDTMLDASYYTSYHDGLMN